MRWRSLGKIFDPREHSLPLGMGEFAQSPQALVFDTHIRIYFSTRSRDADGAQFRTHVLFADFSTDLSRVLGISKQEVIPLGELGTFDEHGIFPMNVLRVEDRVYGFTSGVSRRISVPVDTAIGLVVSRDDGASFERVGNGPILAPTLHEPCIIADPFVARQDGQFRMWYIFGHSWRHYPGSPQPERVYKITHATSPDCQRWVRADGKQIIADALGEDECQALPTVIQHDGKWHMVFCYRQPFGFRQDADRGYRLGYATSPDGISWSRDDSLLQVTRDANGWDADMQCYPHMFKAGGKTFLLYNGNLFGRYGFGAAVLEGASNDA